MNLLHLHSTLAVSLQILYLLIYVLSCFCAASMCCLSLMKSKVPCLRSVFWIVFNEGYETWAVYVVCTRFQSLMWKGWKWLHFFDKYQLQYISHVILIYLDKWESNFMPLLPFCVWHGAKFYSLCLALIIFVVDSPLVYLVSWFFYSIIPIFQATIGIDFLSKTMYLEDRTVSRIS